jgi:uncharacterized protein (TIGR03437 family)
MFPAFLRFPPLREPLAAVIPTRLRGQIRHRTGSLAMLCLGLLWVQRLSAQPPQITASGVVNAASYAQPISPGSIVSIFGTNLATTTASAGGTSLPLALAGTSVTLNGVNAPLFFVSPGQINLQASWSLLDPSETAYSPVTVVVSTPLGSSAPVQAPMYASAPAIFSLDASGCGRAAALNAAPDGSVSLNSPSNSAAPGDYISIYGTGLGLVYDPPPDGTPAPGPQVLQFAPGVWIDSQPIPGVSYGGLAPTLVAVDQLNFQIPASTREGCAVPVSVAAYIGSPTLSISIHSGRGQCVDPPTYSYGQVLLTKTVASGTGNDGETDTLTAVFPAGPGLKMPSTPTPLSQGTYFANSSVPVPVSRSCSVAGYENLSAGVIEVQSNTGVSVTAQPISQTGGVIYQQTLPAGFIAPGPYTISASGGPVTFRAGLNVDMPIQIQTPFPPGTAISSSQPLTVAWTGGTAGMLVKVTLVSPNGILTASDYSYADAGSGSFTFEPSCTGGALTRFCTFSLALSNDAQIIVEFSPGNPALVAVQGITGSVQTSWTYRYVFGGLVLGY